MECMHRFCGACIQRCLRGGKQECPSCRQHVPSRRSLRRDTNFDAAIRKIFPNLEAHERRADRRIKKTNMANARVVAQKLKQGIKQQDEHRRKFRYVRAASAALKRQKLQQRSADKAARAEAYANKKAARKSSSSSSSASRQSPPSSSGSSSSISKKRKKKNKKKRESLENGNYHNRSNGSGSRSSGAFRHGNRHGSRGKGPSSTSSSSSYGHYGKKKPEMSSEDAKDEVRFQLKFDGMTSSGGLSDLEYPWLQTSGNIQVKHLKKYLSRKLNIDKALSILVKVQGIPIVLQDDLRYHEINDANAMRVLYYRLAA